MSRAGRRATIAGCVPLLVALLVGLVWAQPGDAPVRPAEVAAETAPGEDAAKPPIAASQLDTFLLRDSKGNLVPVLGMSFEEFERLLKLKRGLAPPAPPDYSLDAIAVTGVAKNGVATLDVVATVRVRGTDWVRIPLRMNQVILKQTAEHTGKGELFVTCEADGDGYLCWLKATPDADDESDDEASPTTQHQIKLQVAVPLQEVGDEQRLAMKLPRATESSLKIETPIEKVEASLRSGGDGLLTTRSIGAGRSEISLLGAAGDVQVSWRPMRAANSVGALEAIGEVSVKVEGRTRVSSDAKLRVRSNAGTIESFQVRLPPGMELNPSVTTGYSAVVATSDSSDGRASQIVEVKLDRPANGPVDIRLSASLSSQARSGAALEPASWEVVGAARQRGTVEVAVDGDWLLQWTEDSSVRRVETPVDSTSLGKLAARFEYFRQPSRLKLQVLPRPTRITVEPTYVIYVDAEQTRLEAKLRYRMRGTRAQSIAIDPGGWNLDRLSPDSYFAVDAIASSSGSTWQLPLASDVPSEMEVQLSAHRESPASEGMLELSLPRPQAELTTPATVVIVPGDNVELIPDSGATRGLTVESLPSGIALPVRQQPPLVYRDLGGTERALLAARFRLRERITAVSTETTVRLDRRRVQVTQNLQYRISHEPQRVFELSIPAELQRASGLSVAFGDEVLPLEPISAEPSQPSASAYRFVAPRDLIGPCEFTIKYALPTPALSAGEATAFSIPLPVPADRDESEFSRHTLTVRHADDIKLDSVEPPRDARSGPAKIDSPQETQLQLLHPVSEIDVVASAVQSQDSAAVAVHRAWIQSWVSHFGRQDRAVWRLTPRQSSIRLKLPGGSNLSEVQAAWNERPVERIVREKDLLVIAVPAAMQGKEQVLEVWYSVKQEPLGWGISRETLEPPAILNSSSVQRLYWELSLPSHVHLLSEPQGFAAELDWQWRRLFWERQATVTQRELEQWTGASEQPALPPGVNTYVFSSFGATPPLRVTWASHRAVLGLFSAVALAVGLALVHVRAFRQPVALLVVAVLLVVAALWAPETTLFVGQAVMLGVVIAVLSTFGLWLTTGRPAVAPTASSSAVVSPTPLEARSTQMPTPRTDRPSPSTTATSPLSIPVAEPRP